MSRVAERTDELEQLRDLVSKQQREIRELTDARSVALKIIADQQHELARLRRALSHS
jgi:predicted  nucleic acid-binding Zn-ribbon protein